MAGKNFDELAARFKRNVYTSHKGEVRISVLSSDFKEFIPTAFAPTAASNRPLRVLDAGGGQAQFSIQLAQLGHRITLCDLSEQMIVLAKESAVNAGVEQQFEWVHSSIQDYCASSEQQYDLILSHALLEWVDEPQAVLHSLIDKLKPGGYFSLIYYNLNGLIYKNLLRTNFKKIRKQQWQGYRGSLTPAHPVEPQTIDQWLQGSPLKKLCESGIRVFSDYIFDKELRKKNHSDIIEMELQFSRQQPYVHLGRYIHLLMQKE